MIGALVGAGLQVAGGIAGGIAGRKAARKAQRELEQQKRENEDWYNRRYNEDATQRADAQRALQRAKDFVRNRSRAAAGTQAVVGGSEASVAATKEANNEMMANAVGQIAAAGEARKDAIEADYRNRKAQLSGQQSIIEEQKAANVVGAVHGLSGAAGAIAGALDGTVGSKESVTTTALNTNKMSHGLSQNAIDEANADDISKLKIKGLPINI